MEKERKNKFIKRLWNANTAIKIANILKEFEYEVMNESKLRQGAVSEPLPLLCTCFRFNGTDSFSGNCNVCGNRSR